MKIKLSNPITPRRGRFPQVGDVYTNAYSHYYKIVLAVVKRDGTRPWKNVVLLHVAATAEIIGCSMQPELYIRDHQDYVGRVDDLPDFEVKWLKGTPEVENNA